MTVSTPSRATFAGPGAARLGLSAVAAAIGFTLAWLILGLLSPGYPLFDTYVTPYSPVSQPISGLGLGVTGPYMNAAFVVTGVLLLVGAAAVSGALPSAGRPARRRVAMALLLIPPVGVILDGLFTLESVMVHLLGFLLAAGLSPVGFALLGVHLRASPSWRTLGTGLIVASVTGVTLLGTFFATFDPASAGANTGLSGLIQRALVTVVLGGYAALGVHAFREERRRQDHPRRR